jgi:hypothetical protein
MKLPSQHKNGGLGSGLSCNRQMPGRITPESILAHDLKIYRPTAQVEAIRRIPRKCLAKEFSGAGQTDTLTLSLLLSVCIRSSLVASSVAYLGRIAADLKISECVEDASERHKEITLSRYRFSIVLSMPIEKKPPKTSLPISSSRGANSGYSQQERPQRRLAKSILG